MRVTRLPILALPAVLAVGLATSTLAPAGAAPPDDTVPTIEVLGARWQKVYPAADGYRDATRVSYTTTDAFDTAVDVTVTVSDGAANVLGSQVLTAVPTGSEAIFQWDGSDLAGGALTAGDYTLTFTASDVAGNTSTADAITLAVDEGRLVTKTYKNSITAKRSIVEKDVRRCGDLRGPVRGWRQSLGYYANARCNRSGVASVAATVNGMYVPKAFKDADRGSFYKNITVKTYGGNARQRPGAEGYLQYWNYADQKWFAGTTMGSRVGNHAGASRAAKPMVVPNGDKPYVIWSMLTANGHWYDVKKFSVVMKYQVMKRPAVEAPAVPAGVPGDVAVTAPQLP
jgi:hypothetical protein